MTPANKILFRHVMLPCTLSLIGYWVLSFSLIYFYIEFLSIYFGRSAWFVDSWIGDLYIEEFIISIVFMLSLSTLLNMFLKKWLSLIKFRKEKIGEKFSFTVLIIATIINTHALSYASNTKSFVNIEKDELMSHVKEFTKLETSYPVEVEGRRGYFVHESFASKYGRNFNGYCTVLVNKSENIWIGKVYHFYPSRDKDNFKDSFDKLYESTFRQCKELKLLEKGKFYSTNFNIAHTGYLHAAKLVNKAKELDLSQATILIKEEASVTLSETANLLLIFGLIILIYDLWGARLNWSEYEIKYKVR